MSRGTYLNFPANKYGHHSYEKTLLAIADFWKKLTQHPELMYLTGGKAMNSSGSGARSRSENWVR